MSRLTLIFALITFSIFAEVPPFTGKVQGNKVRLRTKPDLEGYIVKTMNKNDLLLVVGEQGDFWKVAVPKGVKAYIFRSYVLENTVEAARVNVRLAPTVDAPIIGSLHSGDKIAGDISLLNNKWLEITPPQNVHLYISKEYVTRVGDSDYLAIQEKRKEEAEKLLHSSYQLAKEECQKPFIQMHPEAAIAQLEQILQGYADCEEEYEQAKEGLAALQDNYLQKKLAYLEANISENSLVSEVVFPKVESGDRKNPFKSDPQIWDRRLFVKKDKGVNGKMSYWDRIEEGLFASWSNFHSDKKRDDFYREQKANAFTLNGVIEASDPALRNRPGDFILKENGIPTAYIYSTHIDLKPFVGKGITLQASPRPNNHYAFPAYFVLEVE